MGLSGRDIRQAWKLARLADDDQIARLEGDAVTTVDQEMRRADELVNRWRMETPS